MLGLPPYLSRSNCAYHLAVPSQNLRSFNLNCSVKITKRGRNWPILKIVLIWTNILFVRQLLHILLVTKLLLIPEKRKRFPYVPHFHSHSVFINKTYNFNNKLMWKNAHPIYCAWIWTHDLQNMSHPIATRPGLPPSILSFFVIQRSLNRSNVNRYNFGW